MGLRFFKMGIVDFWPKAAALAQPIDLRDGSYAGERMPQALEPTREKRARGDRFIDLGPT